MSFSDLKSDVLGAVKNAGSLFGIGDSTPYPAKYAYVTNVIKENDKSWRKSVGYRFRVVRDGNTDQDAEGWQAFTLQINPESLTQDEIFAIQVTPTFSGVLVEHQGVTLKDINISGTTGVSPNRSGPSGAFSQSGRPVFASGRSGYAEFHELRNYIRAYVEQKRNDPDLSKGELRLIWDNLRDHESLFVEPQKFQMKRSARKPFMYDYNIALKGIGIASEKQNKADWAEILDTVIEDTIGLLDAAAKILEGAADFVSKVEQEFATTQLVLIKAIVKLLKSGDKLSVKFKKINNFLINVNPSDINKLNMKNLKKSLDKTQDDAYDLTLGSKVTSYNESKGNVTTLKGSSTGSISGSPVVSPSPPPPPPTYEEMKAIKGFAKAKKGIVKLFAIDDEKIFTVNPNDLKNQANALYNAAKKNQALSAALSTIKKQENILAKAKASGNQGSIKAAQAAYDTSLAEVDSAFGKSNGSKTIDTSTTTTKEITVQAGTTIQNLSSNYLGDSQKFKELVVINNLLYPYIETEAPVNLDGSVNESAKLPGVLYPGDKIKIPTNGISVSTGVKDLGNSYPIEKGFSKAEKNLGVDVMLNDDGDMVIASNGDVDLIASVANLSQAIVILLLMEPGGLKRHPEIGTSLAIGEKALNTSLVADQIRKSLASDSRIDSVIFVEVFQEGSAISINMILKVKDVDQPLKIPLTLVHAA